jgi:ribosome maturation protein Sdo1
VHIALSFRRAVREHVRGHRAYLKHLKAFFGDRRLDKITTRLVEDRAASHEAQRRYRLEMAEHVRQAVEKVKRAFVRRMHRVTFSGQSAAR